MMELRGIALALVVVGILLGFGLLILAEVQTEIGTRTTTTSAAYNATGDAIDGLSDMAGWLGLLVLVIMAALIIGYLLAGFGNKAIGST